MSISVSAVLPCFNAAPWIGAAIDSIRRQTQPPTEIVVVDDGSTDGSEVEAARAGARVIRTGRNRGAAAARNVGLRAASGEFVAWLDADDEWEPQHLETVVGLLKSAPEAVLAFSRARMTGDVEGEWPSLLEGGKPVWATEACLRRCVLPHNAVVVRREWVMAAGGYDERLRLAEDYDLWLRLSTDHPFICTDAVTVRWRRHAQQTSRDMFRYWEGEYESRDRFYRRVCTEAPAAASKIADRLCEVWLQHVTNAWHARRNDFYEFHIRMASRVPNSRFHVRRLQQRRLLLPIARMVDAVRHAYT